MDTPGQKDSARKNSLAQRRAKLSAYPLFMFKYIHASVVRTAGFRIIRIYRCFFPFVHTHQMTQIYAVSHCIVRHLLYTADSQIIIVLFRAVGVCPSYKLESMACFFCRLDKSIQIRRLISAGDIGIISEMNTIKVIIISGTAVSSSAGVMVTVSASFLFPLLSNAE